MRAIPAVATLLILCACNPARGSSDPGSKASRAFPLSGFDRIALKGSDEVRVVTGTSFSVTASGPQAVLDLLEIGVDDHTLRIARKSRQGWHLGWSGNGWKGAVITVTMPAVSGLSLTGSGDMTVDRVEGSAFDASLTGSGDLNIAKARIGSLSLRVAGSGDLAISGTANTAKISVVGSGDVRASSMSVRAADVHIMGSGDVSLHASENAAVSLMGSGDATIAGTAHCTVSKLGSGNVHCPA